VRAQARWVRMSARKARLVTDHIRGRTVPEARTVLAFTPRAAAREIEKVLRSAVANAEANHGLLGDDLYVSAAVVDEGPTLKRWRARARGRAARIRKRTCHITLELAPVPETAAPATAAEKPRRGRRQTPEAAVPGAAEAPRRTRRPKAEPAPEETAEETAETTAAAEPAEVEEASKPKRTRAKKTEEADQTEATEPTEATEQDEEAES
jgi:large subunit ribosomal protein L22